MKRLLLIASLVLIPAGLFLGAWQSYNYHQLDAGVSVLEKKQQDLIESNKRLIAQIAADTSARVVEARAQKELNMAWPNQNQIVKLVLKQVYVNTQGAGTADPAANTASAGSVNQQGNGQANAGQGPQSSSDTGGPND